MAVKLQAAALVAMVLLSTVSAVDPNAKGWFKAQATYYTSPGSGGDEGSCAYGRINDRFATGRAFCAIPDNDGSLCGRCLEVKCDASVVTNAWGKTWEYPKYQCNGESVIVMVTDNCPSDRNAEWCSKHMPHCDLSYEAFSKIVKVVDGIAATQMRWVECPGTLPPKCSNPIKPYGACGNSNGPYGCCGPYLKCTQKSAHYWQCLGDQDTNWNSGRQSSGPSNNGGGSVVITSEANRRRRIRKPAQTRRRNNPQKKKTPPRRGGGGRAIGHWGQCGGRGGPTGNQKGGRDGPWGGYYCQKGSCRRYNAWWWQCK